MGGAATLKAEAEEAEEGAQKEKVAREKRDRSRIDTLLKQVGSEYRSRLSLLGSKEGERRRADEVVRRVGGGEGGRELNEQERRRSSSFLLQIFQRALPRLRRVNQRV